MRLNKFLNESSNFVNKLDKDKALSILETKCKKNWNLIQADTSQWIFRRRWNFILWFLFI